jgi:hypothetical protein
MFQEDLNFLQVVSIVTSRLGCSIDSIDIEGRTALITCPGGTDQEMECASAIEQIMERRPNATGIWALS